MRYNPNLLEILNLEMGHKCHSSHDLLLVEAVAALGICCAGVQEFVFVNRVAIKLALIPQPMPMRNHLNEVKMAVDS